MPEQCNNCDHTSCPRGLHSKSPRIGKGGIARYFVCDITGEMVFDFDECPLEGDQ